MWKADYAVSVLRLVLLAVLAGDGCVSSTSGDEDSGSAAPLPLTAKFPGLPSPHDLGASIDAGHKDVAMVRLPDASDQFATDSKVGSEDGTVPETQPSTDAGALSYPVGVPVPCMPGTYYPTTDPSMPFWRCP